MNKPAHTVLCDQRTEAPAVGEDQHRQESAQQLRLQLRPLNASRAPWGPTDDIMWSCYCPLTPGCTRPEASVQLIETQQLQNGFAV